MEFERRIVVTGGAGFIGSHVVRLMVNKYPKYQIINLDALTYAGNLENLRDIETASNYSFQKGDITDLEYLQNLFAKLDVTDVIHLAAESHVDRSITDPLVFVRTNVLGTANILHAALKYWQEKDHKGRFYHVSTDEVYGSLGDTGFFTESTPYEPKSPYSASKASSDHFVRAYENTYGMDVVLSNCSNNYGSFQFPEKLIPLMINNIKHNKPLPVYGKGHNVRDWLWVEDHAKAIDVVFHQGKTGETYNIGGHNEWKNIDIVHLLCEIMDEELDRTKGASKELITYVTDRAGHDFRYAIDASYIDKELSWKPSITFEQGIRETVKWYLNNTEWMERVTTGAYKEYYEKQYQD